MTSSIASAALATLAPTTDYLDRCAASLVPTGNSPMCWSVATRTTQGLVAQLLRSDVAPMELAKLREYRAPDAADFAAAAAAVLGAALRGDRATAGRVGADAAARWPHLGNALRAAYTAAVAARAAA